MGTLEALVEAGYEITGVVTQPSKPKGRETGTTRQLKEAAEKHGLPVYQPRRVRDAEAIEEIPENGAGCDRCRCIRPDYSKRDLDMPKITTTSTYPASGHRGSPPIQWAVTNGDEVSGVTIMRWMKASTAGDMLTKVEFRLQQMRPAAVSTSSRRSWSKTSGGDTSKSGSDTGKQAGDKHYSSTAD